jgi:hypothetical protein
MSNKYNNLYENKYLKYKNKYLSLKKLLGGARKNKKKENRERIEKWKNEFTDNKQIFIYYDIKKNIRIDRNKIYNVSNLEILMPNETTSLKNEILESLIDFNIDGYLKLSNNELESLPNNFYLINIGGSLDLNNNQLESLPNNFHQINIGGSLFLYNNQLKSLPNNFHQINIGESLYLQNNHLTRLPENFEKIKCQDLYLNDNLLKTLPISFTQVSGHLILTNNYILPSILEQLISNKRYDINHQNVYYNKCSYCKKSNSCKKCAICKDVWYCSETCEIEAWTNHSIVCNNIINTTFFIVAHGVLIGGDTNITNDTNMNIITLNDIEKYPSFHFVDNIIEIYKGDKTLYENNDTSLHKLTEAGKKFYDYCSNQKIWALQEYEVTCHIRNRSGSNEFNNQLLIFSDDSTFEASKIKINCFKKHENGKLEINNNYNSKWGEEINSDVLINEIIDLERNTNNNKGHITFIILACRGFSEDIMSEEQKELVRAKSDITDSKIELSRTESLLMKNQPKEEIVYVEKPIYKTVW